MTVDLTWGRSSFPPFVKCLKSLPNLHTLEIGWVDNSITAPLQGALKGAKLPQIKTLILPPAAHPLLQHCRDVEDVVCAVRDQTTSLEGFLGSLASNRDSKVKQLAIPLVTWVNSSRKRFDALWDHDVVITTNYLRPQNLWPRAQGSPNSPSSSLTYIGPSTRKRGFCSIWVKEHVPQYQIWSVRAKRSQISTHSRSYVFL